MINKFRYGQTWKIWPSPFSLSLYSTFNCDRKYFCLWTFFVIKYFRSFVVVVVVVVLFCFFVKLQPPSFPATPSQSGSPLKPLFLKIWFEVQPSQQKGGRGCTCWCPLKIHTTSFKLKIFKYFWPLSKYRFLVASCRYVPFRNRFPHQSYPNSCTYSYFKQRTSSFTFLYMQVHKLPLFLVHVTNLRTALFPIFERLPP